MAYNSTYGYTPPPSSENTDPLQTVLSGSRPVRQTIPFKQFQRAPVTQLQDYEYDHRESEEQLFHSDISSDEESPIEESSAGRTGSEGPPDLTRRRNTLTGTGDGFPQTQSRRASPRTVLRRDSHANSEMHEMKELGDADLRDDAEVGLTGQERKARTRQKRSHTLLDERIASSGGISKEDKKAADQNVAKNLFVNAALTGLWYLFSLSISIYNKWMFSPDHLDFHFPLFTTCMHMLVQFALASLVLFFFPRFRPRHDALTNPGNLANMSSSDRFQYEQLARKPLMTRWFYATRLGPCGMATGLDIGLGNMSLKFITLTFYTMVKSSALAFVLLFAFLFRLETPSILLVLIISVMTMGVILMVSGETSFSLPGFILILSAAFFSGFRWALTQILLLRNPATSNPFASIFYLAPIMFATLGIIALFAEGLPSLLVGLSMLMESEGTFAGPCILLAPGILAFCMTSSEFALLQRTSVVTLSIAGIFKEVVTISAAAIVFKDRMSPPNVVGLLVTIGAIAAYNYIKIRKMRQEARVEVAVGKAGGGAYEAVGNGDDEESDDDAGHYTTADGDVLSTNPGAVRPKGPERYKSKDPRVVPPIGSRA